MERTDFELIQSLRAGDATAFDVLFDRYRQGVLAYVRGLLGRHELAEEVTQDVFLELVRSIDRVDPGRGASAWLYRVARNRAYDILRRRKFDAPMEDEDVLRVADELGAGDPSEASAGLEQAERAAVLHEALATLEQAEREILMLHYISERPFREIAEILKRPLGTVLWKSRRSLEKLNQMLGDRDDLR